MQDVGDGVDKPSPTSCAGETLTRDDVVTEASVTSA